MYSPKVRTTSTPTDSELSRVLLSGPPDSLILLLSSNLLTGLKSMNVSSTKSTCPCLYLLYASDLRTLSPHNVIVKYADDTTLLVGQHSSVDISQEYENICSWSFRNRPAINTDKTKEIVFHLPASRHLNTSPPLSDIERVTQATLLGIDMPSTLSASA